MPNYEDKEAVDTFIRLINSVGKRGTGRAYINTETVEKWKKEASKDNDDLLMRLHKNYMESIGHPDYSTAVRLFFVERELLKRGLLKE